MIMVNIFSLSVSGETLPKPTEVMQVMVKYRADMYMVHLLGPPTRSRGNVMFLLMGSKGACLLLLFGQWLVGERGERQVCAIIAHSIL